jgi:predicted DNA-binding protein (UPF0251 family)
MSPAVVSEVVSITVEELEALRLVDVEGLRQEDTAISVRIEGELFGEI